jgi:hypothetical protein
MERERELPKAGLARCTCRNEDDLCTSVLLDQPVPTARMFVVDLVVAKTALLVVQRALLMVVL